MTEDRKTPTPGMAEVSPKFVHQAAAAVGGEASAGETLSVLWQEWRRLWEANKEAAEELEDDELAMKIFAALGAVERRMEAMPARTTAEALNKLRVAGIWINVEKHPQDTLSMVKLLTLSALADLERLALAGEAAPIGEASLIEDPVPAMTNVTEIDMNEMMRREDAPLLDFVDQWERAYHKYLAAEPGEIGGLPTQIESLEGQIVRHTPATFRGLCSILGMAHTILSTRDANDDLYMSQGPATALVARAIAAVDREDGMIGSYNK